MSRFFRILLAVISGVLLSFAWLGMPAWILFFAFIPLLALDYFFVIHKSEYKSVSFWGYSFFAFLIWNGLSTWWIAYATLPGAIMAIVANSFLMSLICWAAHIARRRLGIGPGYMALIVFWLSFEYFHFHWDIEWPWLNIGNGFANNVKMIQWYEYTGILGGSLWVLLINIIIFRIGVNFYNKKNVVYQFLTLMFILFVPLCWSYLKYNSYEEKGNPLNVVVIQPNIDPYNEEYDMEAENRKLKKFVKLGKKEVNEETDLIIGPETIFERYPNWNTEWIEVNPQFRELYKWVQNYSNAEVIFGASTCKIYKDKESATPTARMSNNMSYDVFNSAVFINRSGEGGLYHKSILVSGVEKMPFRKYLGFLNDLVFDLGGTTGSLGVQENPSLFTLKNGCKVAPVICYESVFGGYITEFVKKGAGVIAIITNDGWWRDTPGYKQHLSFARLRAIETRRAVARAANTGVSCFINQKGDIIKSTEWWTDDAIIEKINCNDKITFYVRYGDYIARMSMFISALLLLFMLVKKYIKK